MHMIYMMRYSFFGQSGWRSVASGDPAKLFDPKRLDEREYYLRKVALASLRDQADQDFDLIVLSSSLMPLTYQKRLVEICHDMIGPRARVIFEDPGVVARKFHRYRMAHFNRYENTAQIVLDDDDALAVDFTSDLRGEATAALALRKTDGPEYCFLSFPRGLTAQFENGRLDLIERNVPATNLGLALVGPTQTNRSPFRVAHYKILERRPVRVVYTQEPQYLRSVHGSNDSKARRGDTLVDPEAMPQLLKAFPLLKDLRGDWEMERKLHELVAERPERVLSRV